MKASLDCVGAGDETRTRDLNLGKVALYQLSYSRMVSQYNQERGPLGAPFARQRVATRAAFVSASPNPW